MALWRPARLLLLMGGSVLTVLVPFSTAALAPAGSNAAGVAQALSEDIGCTVEPRPLADLSVLFEATPGVAVDSILGTPIAMPEPPSGGSPADADTARAVEQTVDELVACLNAGELSRVLALYTDSYVLRVYGGVFDVESLTRAATPVPLPKDQQAKLISVKDVRILDDGRVSAIAQINDASSLVAFKDSGDQYLVDSVFPLDPDATPLPDEPNS